MIKKYAILLSVGFLGGLSAFFIVFNFGFLERAVLNNFKSDIQKANATKQILPSLSPERNISNEVVAYGLAPADFWQKIVIDQSFNFAAVQAFKDNQLLRQGNGIFLSSDGLIVTTSDIALASASVFQVLYEDKILRGNVVARDYAHNLALLRVSGSSDFNVPELDFSDNYQSGQELIIVGKLINLSKPIVFSQKTFINYKIGKSIFLDVQPKSILNGGAVINDNDRIVGVVYIRGGKVYFVDSQTVYAFLKNYLNKNQSK